jgi:hypothetical protein
MSSKEKISMTGRDYKKLVKLHRDSLNKIEPYKNENFRQLTKLIENRSLIKKYNPVDYELYKEFINERKQAAGSSFSKVKQLESASRLKKDALFAQHHVGVWLKEWSRLESQFKMSESELDDLVTLFEQNSVDYVDLVENENDPNDQDEELESFFGRTNNLIDDLDECKMLLTDDRIKFNINTIYPVNELKEDLQYFLRTSTVETMKNDSNRDRIQQILRTIEHVKEQEKKLYEHLENEFELIGLQVEDDAKKVNDELMIVSEGVPDAAYELDSPDPELKVQVHKTM